MWRDAFPPISSKSHLIRAICACRAVRDCADRKLHRGVPRVRSRRKGCGSESCSHSGFSLRFSSTRTIISARGAARAASCRRASRCHTFSMGQDKFLPLCSAQTRLAIVLYRDTSHSAEHVNFVRRCLFRKRFPLLSRNFWINKGWLSRYTRSANMRSQFFISRRSIATEAI